MNSVLLFATLPPASMREEEIKRINKELQRKNNEMQQFVYTVSHD